MEPLWILMFATGWLLLPLFVLISIIIIAALENDSPRYATFGVVVAGLFLWFFTDFSHRYHIEFSGRLFWSVIIIYAVVAASWSLFHWYLDLREIRANWLELIRLFRDEKNIPKDVVVNKDYPGLLEWLSRNGHHTFITGGFSSDRRVRIKPVPNKSKNIARMAYWPWDMFWTILDDVFKHIYNMMVGAYYGLANYVFRDID